MDHPSISRDELVARLPSYQFYHCIDLGDGIVTPGHPYIQHVQGPTARAIASLELNDKRVLEVGCCDGLFSIQAEGQGASEIDAIDNSLSRGAVELVLPWLKSRIKMREQNFYDLVPSAPYDLVIFAGILYHLRMPFFAIKRLADLTKPGGCVVIETALYLNTDHSMLFCPNASESPYEATSVTFFSHHGLVSTLESMGFVDAECLQIIVEAPLTPNFDTWNDFAASDLYTSLDRDSKPLIGRGTYICKRSTEDDDLSGLCNSYWYGQHSANAGHLLKGYEIETKH
jgi:SAM-dependent methyltransferase